jgi:hypothetical protein
MKEHALYALSCFGLRKMGLDVTDNDELRGPIETNKLHSIEIKRVENGVQVPIY